MFLRLFRHFYPIPRTWHWHGNRMRRLTADGEVVYRDLVLTDIADLEAYYRDR